MTDAFARLGGRNLLPGGNGRVPTQALRRAASVAYWRAAANNLPSSNSLRHKLRAIMSFEFGIFHEFSRSPGQTDAEAFAQSFAQVDAAEHWGLDVVWLANCTSCRSARSRHPWSSPLRLRRERGA